jgi:hypothetical protein
MPSTHDPRHLPETGDKILLINPPVCDTRLHWSQWLQPLGLLQLATYAKHVEADARLIDALSHKADERIPRRRVEILELDESRVNKWRFGETNFALTRQLRELRKDGWYPDRAYVECLVTFWWEGAAEVAKIVSKIFPKSTIYLIGSYGELAPRHAQEQMGEGVIVASLSREVQCLPSDLSVCPQTPRFAYITLGAGYRDPEAVVAEITSKAEEFKVQSFAFVEHGVADEQAETYRKVLELLATHPVKANLYALGNISPADMVAHPDLAQLMRRAGYRQIVFADDRGSPLSEAADEALVEAYRQSASLLQQAGFPLRTDVLVGSICIGRLGEDLESRAALATHVAHHIGSIIPWAYQPTIDECPDLRLEDQNGKLFPLRKRNGRKHRDYLDLLALATILNAKYREHTFDFLGEGLVPTLFRQSVASRGWDPDPEVKGTLSLPAKPASQKR